MPNRHQLFIMWCLDNVEREPVNQRAELLRSIGDICGDAALSKSLKTQAELLDNVHVQNQQLKQSLGGKPLNDGQGESPKAHAQ